MKKRIHLMVSGRVQGVCFRMRARDEAERLGLAGFVRNLPGGNVEVVAEGEEEDLAGLSAWCRHGPPYARVTGVEERYGEIRNEFNGFRIAH